MKTGEPRIFGYVYVICWVTNNIVFIFLGKIERM